MSVNMNDPGQLNGTTVVGGDGEKLGNVDAVYYDNATDRAEWVAVRSGLFGTRLTLVPLRRADYTGNELRVPFDKVQLRNAPHHDPGNELSSTDEADLYRYYGIDYSDTAGFAATPHRDGGRSWGDAMTRSEEHLRVGTTSDEVGRARLRRQVVAERGPVTGQRTVEGDVRQERIEYDGAELDTVEHDLRDTRN
jgi:PRC-barrel domain